MRIVGVSALLSLCLFGCGEDGPAPLEQCTESCPDVCSGQWTCTAQGDCICGAPADLLDGDAEPRDGLGELEQRDDVEAEVSSSAEYRFVRIDDITTAPTGENPGADLDAVVVTKWTSGWQFFAEDLVYFELGSGDPVAVDAMEILGPPDSFVDWAVGDLSRCDSTHGFVSLGKGGRIIVRMSGRIDADDVLEVLELSRCSSLSGPGEASDDSVDVFVSVSNALSGTWIPVGSGIGPSISMTIPALP